MSGKRLRMKMRSMFCLFSTLLVALQAMGQSEPRKTYSAVRANPSVPVIDGRLDDPAWAGAAWEGGFTQFRPVERDKPSENTEFKIVYDDSNIYVAVRCWDSQAAAIERRVSRRDNNEGDLVEVTLDSLFDHLTSFSFVVNAAGVKGDGLARDSLMSRGPDMSWDPIWTVKTSVDAQGWNAEMRIPLSQLRFGKKTEQVWGLQVMRYLFRKDEVSLWQFIPRNTPGWAAFYGELHGLRDLRPPRQVELVPYAVARQQVFKPVPGNPFATGGRRAFFGGLDGKVGVTSDLTLTFTLNPDFGQVEADPSVVNLTAFETYFEEKRPFFIEGRNLFHFQLTPGGSDYSLDNLFYSRRVGRSPQYVPDAAEDVFVDQPEATSILGAFKLTGKMRNGLSIGIMESFTGQERASLSGPGLDFKEAVEPWTSYFGLRLQQDFRQGATTLGGMLTSVNRDPRREEHLKFLHDSAVTGGLDFTHSWNNRNYSLSLSLIFSRVAGSPQALERTQESAVHFFQRPDASHLEVDPRRTSLSGHGGSFNFGKVGGGMLTFLVGATWRSPGLELNDMGFLRQADRIMEFVWSGLNFTNPFFIFRSANVSATQWQGWNFNGEGIYNGVELTAAGQFKNFWNGACGIVRDGESLPSSDLRGGPSLRHDAAWTVWGNLQTDSRRKVRFNLNGMNFAGDNGENRSAGMQAGVTIQPGPSFQLSLSPFYGLDRNELQYVATLEPAGETRYVLAALKQRTVGLTARFSFSLTPDLSIQFYGMPFISAGKYDRFKYIIDSRSRDWENRYHLYAPGEIVLEEESGDYSVREAASGLAYGFGKPDFNFLEFRANLVLRWEYIPGSTFFIVWSQGRTGFSGMGDFSFGRDLRTLFDIHPHNVFLVKFSYCFQL